MKVVWDIQKRWRTRWICLCNKKLKRATQQAWTNNTYNNILYPLKINHQQKCSGTHFRFKLQGGFSCGRESCSRSRRSNRSGAANWSEISTHNIFHSFSCINKTPQMSVSVCMTFTWVEGLTFYWWRWSGERTSHCWGWQGQSFSWIKIDSAIWQYYA